MRIVALRPAVVAVGCLFSLAAIMALLVKSPTSRRPTVLENAAVIDALVENALKAWHVPGVAVAIVRNDEVVYLKGFGVKEAGKDDPVTPDTLFPIASCTKAFTTAAMAMLVDDDKMDWDDPVRQHVPSFRLADPLANEEVTLRDLVCHRTGLGGNDFLWYRSPWSREEVIRRIGLVKPKHSFRTTFEYQSTMFTTAGAAVESASGMKWEEFVQQRILEPLGMKNVAFTTTAARQAEYASPHRRDHDGKVQVIPWYVIDRPEPAGSIHASARDLSRWVRFHLADGAFEGNQLVSAENLGETHQPQMIVPLVGSARAMNPDTTQMSYGMAWVIQDHREQLLVSHAGAIDGFRAHLTLLPRARIGIVLLNNLERTQMNLALSNALIDELLDLPRRDWNAFVRAQVQKSEAAAREKHLAWQSRRQLGTRPSRELAAYAGSYEHPAYGTAKISVDDGRLMWRWNSFASPLEHYHFDTFVLNHEVLGFPEIGFTLDAAGNVATLKVSTPLEVEFTRVAPER